MKKSERIKLFSEAMGLAPYRQSFRQALITLFGEKDVPRSKFGFSSLKQLYPKIGIKLWRGKPYLPKTVLITNLFNHTPTPIEDGWSVEKTQTLDFRGKNLTYNSHNGTDFAVPIGTIVCTAAPGKVVSIRSEFNRGGKKIFIDHGNGLVTTYAHLARIFVQVGDYVQRAQPIALSGYSGIDGMITFPFGVPHVHFNVWLNCFPVDPFPYHNHCSLWLGGHLPQPHVPSSTSNSDFFPSLFNIPALHEVIHSCKTDTVRTFLQKIPDLYYQGHETLIEMNYYPTRFLKRMNFYAQTFERKPILDLPFRKEDFEKVVFLDEL
jgi:murein DD-endopeptidase